jgi:hypothetical protein
MIVTIAVVAFFIGLILGIDLGWTVRDHETKHDGRQA